MERGEHPEDGAKREIMEELGVEIKIIDLLGIYVNNEYKYQGERIYPLDTVYIASIIKGVPKVKEEISSFEWFSLDKLPKNIAFKCVRKALGDLKLSKKELK